MTTNLNLFAEAIKVLISNRMLGKTCKFLRGLNSLNALRIETLLMSGEKDSRAVITTAKSSAFHGSLKYVFLDSTKPYATILTKASIVNKTAKIGSVIPSM